MHLVRLTGGLYETLLLRDGSVRATTRGHAFEVPEPIGKELLDDKTGRFEAGTAGAAVEPAGPVDPEDLDGV